MKSNKFIPGIYITEYHNDVLPYIYRSIGSKHLPVSKNTLVHFDAHPDLAGPKTLLADEVFDVNKVLSAVDCESWILPAVFAGHFNKMFWFKPSWSPQLIDGIYEFYVGKCPETGTIKTSCKENYFLSDFQYCPEEKLLQKKPFRLVVLTVGISENFNFLSTMLRCTLSNNGELMNLDGVQDVKKRLKFVNDDSSKSMSNFVELFGSGDWVLDIDLDFFSTQDPIKLALGSNQNFTAFRNVYFSSPDAAEDEDLEDFMRVRKIELQEIHDVLKQCCSSSEVKEEPCSPKNILLRGNEDLNQLIHAINERKLNYEMIHDFGESMGNSRLPHHQASEEQISYLLSGAEKILASIKRPPVVITIARSTVDEYCPSSQVQLIQNIVLERLKDLFPHFVEIVKDYGTINETSSS